MLVGEGNIGAVEGDLKRSVAVVGQIHSVAIGNHGILVLGGKGPQGRSLGNGRQAGVGFFGENGAQSGGVVNKEFPAVDVDASAVHTKAVDEDVGLSFGAGTGRVGRNAGVTGVGRGRRGVSVDIQSAFTLRPPIAEIVGPVHHDETAAGAHKGAGGFLGEDLEHVAFASHADVAGAVDVGIDAVDLDVVHVDGGGASIQMDVRGVGVGGQQTKQHGQSHNQGQKPCFFHCTFLLNIVVLFGTGMCCAKDEMCWMKVLLYILNAREVIIESSTSDAGVLIVKHTIR